MRVNATVCGLGCLRVFFLTLAVSSFFVQVLPGVVERSVRMEQPLGMGRMEVEAEAPWSSLGGARSGTLDLERGGC